MSESPGGYNPEETQAHDRLPRERLRSVSLRKLILEWGVAVVVVLAINAVAIAAIHQFDPNRFRVQVGVKYDLLRDAGGDYDSLILGDSTPNQGVIPSVLGEEAGGTWANLATVADMLALNSVWLLTEYIERYGPPERVLLCHVPDMWHREVDLKILSQAKIPINGFGELDPPLGLGAKDKLELFTTRYAPLYSNNESLSRLVMKPWKAENLHHMFDADGFMPMAEQEEGWQEAIEAAKLEHLQQPFAVSDINARSVQRLIDMAQEHGFTLYLTPGSVSPGLAGSAGYQRNFDDMIEQYRAWAASSERVVLILDTPQSFPTPMMYDEDHVTLEGAQRWSKRIAEAIRRHEAASDSPAIGTDPGEDTR